MGASDWSYSVAYQPDVAAALEQLRNDVYAREEYFRTSELSQYARTESEFRELLDPEYGPELTESLMEDWRSAQYDGRAELARTEPTDPDSLLASQPNSGTHSIIDMCRGVSAQPALCTVSPLTDEQSRSFFGTLTPTSDQVVAWMREVDPATIRHRWEGTYVISYLDGQPDHIHFRGFSGD